MDHGLRHGLAMAKTKLFPLWPVWDLSDYSRRREKVDNPDFSRGSLGPIKLACPDGVIPLLWQPTAGTSGHLLVHGMSKSAARCWHAASFWNWHCAN